MQMTFLKEDRVISEFLRSIGPWKNHIVIGGGYALIIYKIYLSQDMKGPPPLATGDLDSLIPRKVPKVSDKSLFVHLKEAGFVQRYKDKECPPTEAYNKEINGVDVELEFLTDDLTRGEKHQNVVISGVSAVPLSYLSINLQTAVKFKTFLGEEGLVVVPSAYIFNKGLIFSRRNNPAKFYKDLYGIWWVASQLGNFSNHVIDDLHSLAKTHSTWFLTFQRNLRRWIDNASQQDWSKLIAQDLSGNLDKPNFLHYIKLIIKDK